MGRWKRYPGRRQPGQGAGASFGRDESELIRESAARDMVKEELQGKEPLSIVEVTAGF